MQNHFFRAATQSIYILIMLVAFFHSCANADESDVLPDRVTRIQALSWSPDGSQFVIATNRVYEKEEENREQKISYLWLVGIDGKSLEQITFAGKDEQGKTVHYQDENPTWSPDGKQIAFDSDRGGVHRNAPDSRLRQIFLCKANGANLRQISSGQDWINNKQPCWHPQGEQMAWVTDRNASADIMLSDASGKEIRYLSADSKTREYYPSWSKNGSKLVFLASPQNNDAAIYINVRDVQPVEDKAVNALALKPRELVF